MDISEFRGASGILRAIKVMHACASAARMTFFGLSQVVKTVQKISGKKGIYTK